MYTTACRNRQHVWYIYRPLYHTTLRYGQLAISTLRIDLKTRPQQPNNATGVFAELTIKKRLLISIGRGHIHQGDTKKLAFRTKFNKGNTHWNILKILKLTVKVLLFTLGLACCYHNYLLQIQFRSFWSAWSAENWHKLKQKLKSSK